MKIELLQQPPQLKRILLQNREYDLDGFNVLQSVKAYTLLFPYTLFIRTIVDYIRPELYVVFNTKPFNTENLSKNDFYGLPMANTRPSSLVCMPEMPETFNKIPDLYWNSTFQVLNNFYSKYNYWIHQAHYQFKGIPYYGFEFLKIWQQNSHNPNFFDDVKLPLIPNCEFLSLEQTIGL